MTINLNGLISVLGDHEVLLNQSLNKLTSLKNDTRVLEEIKETIQDQLHQSSRIDFSQPYQKELLDKLYDQEFFQGHERTYAFETIEEAMLLFQEIQTAHNEYSERIQQDQRIYADQENDLHRFNSEVLKIISMLNECMSSLNRRM